MVNENFKKSAELMLSGQLAYMESYLNVLEERAKIEGISL